jgi:hypothetical protein
MKNQLLALTTMALISGFILTTSSVKAQFIGSRMGIGVKASKKGATGDSLIVLTLDVNQVCNDSTKGISGTVCNIHSGVDTSGSAWQKVVAWDGIAASKKAYDGTPTTLVSKGNGVFTLTFTPRKYFGLTNNAKINGMNFVFNGGGWDTRAKDCGSSVGKVNDFYIQFPINSTVTSINEVSQALQVLEAYPNPAAAQVSITYSVSSASDIAIKMYNMMGAEVAATTNNHRLIGTYSDALDLTKVENGLYFYVIQVDGINTATDKIIVTK